MAMQPTAMTAMTGIDGAGRHPETDDGGERHE